MAKWLRRIRVPDGEKAELEKMKTETQVQATEAKGLLADARVTADRVKRARRRDNYTATLDQIFGGDK